MNQKTLIGLAIAAVVAIALAVVLNQRGQPQSEGTAQAEPLAPGLREHVNDVTRVVVTGADAKVVASFARGADGWTEAEKGGYAADTGKLREFLLKLADARLLEQKTANKDKYAALGVDDVSAKDAKGVQVELDGLAQPLKLIVGTTNTRGGGTFVRRVGEAQSWLASATLTPPKDAADWLRKDLVDVAADRIAEVAITHADGGVVRIAKAAAGDANFHLVDLPKGREAASDFTINGLASTLAGLRFDDVLRAADAAPGDKPVKVRYLAFDGLAVDVTGWQKDGKDYAQFKAARDDERAEKGIAEAQAKAKADYDTAVAAAEAAKASKADKDKEATEAPIKPLSVGDPARDRTDRLAALDREVAELDARFDGWTYVIPAYKYANLDKSLDDLLKPLEDKKAEPAKRAGTAKSGKPGA